MDNVQKMYDRACADIQEYGETIKRLEAERDAALAEVERVRAIHAPLSSLTWGAPDEFQVCEECNDPDARGFIYWPCSTVQALDAVENGRNGHDKGGNNG